MKNGKQLCMFSPIFVDSFAGGGGASTGIELATGHPVDIAINHDQSAIMMHRCNHPYTEHYREDIWMIDPVKVTRGHPVRLAWFSPDCKHFSRAKGAALVDRHIRGLAWVVLRWAGMVRPDVIMLENVPEFVTWGPVRRGRPVKSKAGQTYRKWMGQLRALGYEIETRELCAADYGAPTTRRRFYLIARCDGQPIRWPEPTHAPAGSAEVTFGRCKPWRAAAEIIDWSLPCYSIFADKAAIKAAHGVNVVRPLADNTMRRVIRGVDKFVIRSGRPFLVQCNHAGGDRAQTTDQPMPTVSSHHGFGVVEPIFAPLTVSNTGHSVGSDAGQPVHTVRTGGGGQLMVAPALIQYHTEQGEMVRGQEITRPVQTVDASNRYGLIAANLSKYYGGVVGAEMSSPVPTVTAIDHNAMQVAHLVEYYSTGRPLDISRPMHTVTARDREALTMTHICKFKGQNIGQDAREPLQTVTASAGEFAEVRTEIIPAWMSGTYLGHWPEIRALLNRHCGYSLADNEVLVLKINGADYLISDIGLRMLTPRELYNAMGFPVDYIIDRDADGRPISRAAQVARCGNAVCPAVAEALARANLPECSDRRYGSMGELYEEIS